MGVTRSDFNGTGGGLQLASGRLEYFDISSKPVAWALLAPMHDEIVGR